MNSERKFSSKLGFVLASVGSAVGLGNIWMFPYRVGAYGGAVFIMIYLVFIGIFASMGLSGEFMLGRLTGTGPIGAYEKALLSRGKKGGQFVGWIPLVGSLAIAIGYAVIIGWVASYTAGSVTGSLFKVGGEAYFAKLTGTNFSSVPWNAIVIGITLVALIFGVNNGVEKASKIMMPAFFVFFLIIAIRVAFLPGAIEGYKYLLIPDWSYLLNPKTWAMAMGQAFFTLSITGSGMVIYGSYLKKDENIVKLSLTTGLLDTVASFVSAFAIIPAVFAFGMKPNAGPPLMFMTMPKIFEQMPLTGLFSTVFFVSVLFAGITSLINMLEAVTEACESRVKLNRKVSSIIACGLALLVGLFIEKEANLGAWMDAVTIYLTPFGAFLGAVFIYWILDKKQMENEMNLGREKALPNWFFNVAKYVYVPAALIVVVVNVVFVAFGLGSIS